MKLTVKEVILFGIWGALMFLFDLALDILPNVHLVGVLLTVITVVYRQKALYPLYVYVLLTGLLAGFSVWWIPYLYIWTVLWGAVMLIPKDAKPIVYMLVCAAHGLLFGVLYAPAQALLFGFTFEQTIAWIVAGLPFDAIHCAGNFVGGLLIRPLVRLLQKKPI